MAPRRPLHGLLLVVTALALLVAPSGMARAEEAEPFVLGSGGASAPVAKVRLFYAGYSLQVALGLAATTYENSQSRSLGAAYDLSSALTLAEVKVPELSPMSIDSNAGDAALDEDLGAGPAVGHVSLRATTVPAASSEVRLADVDLPGLVRVEGGHARSSSSIVDGRTRRATASVTVGSVSLLGGVIVLDGLEWETVHETGGTERADAAFTLSRLLVAGTPIATDLHDLDPVLDAVNAALAPLGLVLTAPEVVRRDNGAVDITALRVGLLNSPLGAEAVAPIVAGIRPLLVPVYEALAAVDPTLGLTALVADLGLGVADGSGGIELAIGGATAITDDTVFADPLGGAPPVTAGPVSGETRQGSPRVGGVAAPALPAVPGAPGTDPALVPTSADGPARCVLAASPRRQGTCRGTNLPGAVAVVAVVASAVGAHDLRLRRRRAVVAPVAGGPA